MAFSAIESSNAIYTDEFITANYDYQSTRVEKRGSKLVAQLNTDSLSIRTKRKVPRIGLMLVGWTGNNGTTLTAALLANKLGISWRTKTGIQHANWYGSITQASTIKLGTDSSTGRDVFVPISSMLPMLQPDDIILDGWDISGCNLYEATKRAQVLEPELQDQLQTYLEKLKPRPGIYDPDFIAANQADRADNIITSNSKQEQCEQIGRDIDDFKRKTGVEHVIVVWTANTERFSDIIPGVHDTVENLKNAIASNHHEIAPSVLFSYAALSKGCTYINGSPQNTFIPALVELAHSQGLFIAGDDFKSGQTKLKSVLVDFLISAGIKPVSIVSYNHLGNNDGKNLSAPQQFKSKEISKSSVIDDMVASNRILYKPNESPDHCVVIKYVPYVGDSKRAMDEYTSEIMMGGHNTLVVHNTCEDSLLAAPIILDLVIIAELCTRIQFKRRADNEDQYSNFNSVLSMLSYLCKAPLVPAGAPVINSLYKQRACIENVLRACLGLPPDNNMLLEHKISPLMQKLQSDYKIKEPITEHVIQNGHIH